MTELTHLAWLILLMLGCGLLGGWANYFLNSSKELFGSLVPGVVAAFCVPLFLSMISNNLVIESSTDTRKLLVFGGFCLVASVFAGRFLGSIASWAQIQDAKNTALAAQTTAVEAKRAAAEAKTATGELVNAVVGDESEPEVEPAVKLDLTSDERDVVRRLARRQFRFRSLDGLARELSMEADRLAPILARLKELRILSNLGTNQSVWYIPAPEILLARSGLEVDEGAAALSSPKL